MLAYSNDDLSGRNGVEVISLDGLRDNVGKSFILYFEQFELYQRLDFREVTGTHGLKCV